MNLRRLFKSIPSEANVLAAGSLALFLFKTLALNRSPAAFVGAYELGLLVEGVLGSVIASYAFFVIVVHFREVTDRSRLEPYVAKHVARIANDCQLQLNAFSTNPNRRLDLDFLTLDEVNAAFAACAPYAEAPMVYLPGIANANWLQYLEHFTEKAQRTIGRVLVQLQYIDAELVGLLTSIEDCGHFEHVQLTGSTLPVGNVNLSAWAPTFFEYCERCRALRQYSNARFGERAP